MSESSRRPEVAASSEQTLSGTELLGALERLTAQELELPAARARLIAATAEAIDSGRAVLTNPQERQKIFTTQGEAWEDITDFRDVLARGQFEMFRICGPLHFETAVAAERDAVLAAWRQTLIEHDPRPQVSIVNIPARLLQDELQISDNEQLKRTAGQVVRQVDGGLIRPLIPPLAEVAGVVEDIQMVPAGEALMPEVRIYTNTHGLCLLRPINTVTAETQVELIVQERSS